VKKIKSDTGAALGYNSHVFWIMQAPPPDFLGCGYVMEDFAGYSMSFSPFLPNRVAVAASQYYGIIGNGASLPSHTLSLFLFPCFLGFFCCFLFFFFFFPFLLV
jgi:hypothetical protein